MSSSSTPIAATNAVSLVDLDKQIDHLIKSGAYDNESYPKGKRHEVKRQLTRWLRQTADIETHLSPVPYPILKEQAKARKIPDIARFGVEKFQHVYPSSRHHKIVDKHGNILAYRYSLPNDFLSTLVQTEQVLPPVPQRSTVRGGCHNRHYALWADYSPQPFLSADYRQQLPHSQQWLDANAALFKRLSGSLRFIDPFMYVKFNSIRKYLPADTQPLCGAWCGLAINQGQLSETGPHQDWNNYSRGYNTVIPWGDYTDAQFILWQTKCIYHLAPGDVLMFFGRLIAHNVVGIEGGTWNALELFNHNNVYAWKKKQDLLRRGVVL